MSQADHPIGSANRDAELELFARLPGDEAARERLVEMFLPLELGATSSSRRTRP